VEKTVAAIEEPEEENIEQHNSDNKSEVMDVSCESDKSSLIGDK
jgi:hypothetical protein